MTVNEYKIHHGAALKVFLQSEAGKELLAALHQLRPLFVSTSFPHVHTESSGAVRGFEVCEKGILFLCEPPAPSKEVPMDYGVPEKPQIK